MLPRRQNQDSGNLSKYCHSVRSREAESQNPSNQNFWISEVEKIPFEESIEGSDPDRGVVIHSSSIGSGGFGRSRRSQWRSCVSRHLGLDPTPRLILQKGFFQLRKSKNSDYLDSATPPHGSVQNDSILRGFLNPGSDVWEATLKCFLLVILHEGHACLKLQNLLYVSESSSLGFCDYALWLSAE